MKRATSNMIRGRKVQSMIRERIDRGDRTPFILTGEELLMAYEAGCRLFSHAVIRGAQLAGSKLASANFYEADFSDSDLSGADLSKCIFKDAKLGNCNLSHAKLFGATLIGATLRAADLSYAGLSGADLIEADLRFADLSGATGLLNSMDWLSQNLIKTEEGYYAYKSFGRNYVPRPDWVIEPGQVIEENVNPNPTEDCGCGVNVATYDWAKHYILSQYVWRVLIRWEWLSGVVVPYATDGKFRAARVQLVERIKPFEL